jgi:membrane-bound metal-dependent hydrolase YbcI (DUF457 family)
MLCLLALWAVGLLVAFGLLQFGVAQGAGATSFLDYFYTSGVRIFTLSAEEAANSPPLSKALVIIEAGTGLEFITMVITYLPVLYQLFSRRETHVILLDERAWPAQVGSMNFSRNGPSQCVPVRCVISMEYSRSDRWSDTMTGCRKVLFTP